MKRIFTPQRKQPSTVLFPVLMEKHIEDEKLRCSVTDLQIFVAVDEVTGLNFANVADVNSDAFPEEYDKDGDGKVYIISQGESVAYMDEKEYLAWGKQIFWMPEMKIDWCELGGNLA